MSLKIHSPAEANKVMNECQGYSFIFDSWRSFSANRKRANFTALFGPFKSFIR